MATPEMQQYLGVFLDEAREQLELLETNILEMERGDTSTEILQVLFRAAHTVKGSSRAMGFLVVGDLTHHMEDILDNLRNGRQTATTETVDVLLKCLDTLTVLIDEVASAGENSDTHSADVNALIARLEALANGAPAAASASAGLSITLDGRESSGSVDASAEEVDIEISDYQQTAIDQAAASGLNVFRITVNISTECLMKSVRAYMVLGGLGEIGTVLLCTPNEDKLDAEEFDNRIDLIFAGAVDTAGVERVLGKISEIEGVAVSLWARAAGEHRGGVSGETAQQPAAPLESVPQSGTAAAIDSTKPTNSPAPTAAPAQHSQTIRVDVARLDNLLNLIGEMVIDRTQIARMAADLKARYRQDSLVEQLIEGADRLARITSELQEQVMKARMLPIDGVFQRMPRMVRDLAQKTGKEVRLIMEGGETELDRSVLEVIGDPLIHLLRNSVDHGIEPAGDRATAGKEAAGLIKLTARHEENHIVIKIFDDGRGINVAAIKESAVAKGTLSRAEADIMPDSEALMLIFRSGISTAAKLSDISGRGVGMDIVRSNLEKIGGRISLDTKIGCGTTFTIRLPLTLAIVRGLTVRAGNGTFVFPLNSVDEMIRLGTHADDIKLHTSGGQSVIVLRGSTVPVIGLEASIAGVRSIGSLTAVDPDAYIVVVKTGTKRIGIAVDGLAGEQEVVIKSLGSYLGDIIGVAGATILGDGSVALIVDVERLATDVGESRTERTKEIAHV